MPDWLLIVCLVLLVALSAFFSGCEIVFASANRLRIKNAAEHGSKASRLADYILEHYTDSLSTILIGNNLVNIAASSMTTVLATRHWSAGGASVAAVVLTLVILVFGETLPKILGRERADDLAPVVARPLRGFMGIFRPIVTAVSALVSRLAFLWTPRETAASVTAEELVTLLDTIEEEGVFTPEESDLIKSAIEFGQTDARDIMTPRVDVAAWDIDDGLDALLADQEVMGFSRIPVYRDSVDNIIGILSTKKLLKALVSGQEIDLEAMLTQPLFVHMTRSIPSILLEFRKTHGQMAVVVDEFGGTMGILTMEDIAEELVGEIFDETDEVELPILRQPDGSYLVDGSVSIDDLFEALDYDPVDFDSDYTTVGGWVTELLDRFPAPDDVVTYGPLTLTVLQASSMRVEQLSVVMAEPDAPEED